MAPRETLPLQPGDWETVNQYLGLIPQVFNVKSPPYGAAGRGATDNIDDTAAIDAVLAAAGAAGGIVYVPPGNYLTTGGHSIPENVRVVGAGMGATVIRHTGNNACFSHIPTGQTGWQQAGIEALAIHGTNTAGTTDNTGASAGGIYIEDAYGFLIRDVEVGYQIGVGTKGLYTNGYALRLHNRAAFCEGMILQNFRSLYNGTGIRLTRAAGGNNSFGYNRFKDFRINVPPGGTGLDLDSAGTVAARLYNSELIGNIWLNFTGGVAVDVGAFFAVEASTFADLRGECFTPTCTFIKNRGGTFTPAGLVTLETDGSATNNLASGTNKLSPSGAELHQSSNGGGSTLSVTAVSSATAQVVFAGAAVTYDGSPVIVHASVQGTARGTNSLFLGLFDGTTLVKTLTNTGQTPWIPAAPYARITPTAGSHTYNIRAWVDAGSGAVLTDGFLRVTVA